MPVRLISRAPVPTRKSTRATDTPLPFKFVLEDFPPFPTGTSLITTQLADREGRELGHDLVNPDILDNPEHGDVDDKG